MIKIERRTLPVPLRLQLEEAKDSILGAWNARGIQTSLKFQPVWKVVREFAKDLVFHGKCAYCETPDRKKHDMTHHRPKSGAMNLDHSVDRDHYFWLAYDWRNLYFACPVCSGNKRTMFPVDGKRTELMKQVSRERPFLLDPCHDDPDTHLDFSDDGKVHARSERGRFTIEILKLNRPELVKQRAVVVKRVVKTSDPSPYLRDDAPFAAAARHAVARRRKSTPGVVARDLGGRESAVVEKKALHVATAKAPAQIVQAGYLKWARISNFRGVADVQFDFAPPAESKASWLMLLGENGTGKSSVLQALALALLGTNKLTNLVQSQVIDLNDLIRNGTKTATIEVKTHADPPLITLKLRRAKIARFEYEAGGEGYPGLVLGYGATRLPGPVVADRTGTFSEDEKRIDNLFNPRADLTPAEDWMRQLDNEAFVSVATVLKDLLAPEQENDKDHFEVVGDRVRLISATTTGQPTIGQLSSGFQSVVSLGVDIMQAVAESAKEKRFVTGIVLLDEIDAHLHPTWKMKVVRTLRNCFEQVQFIASTHEPLCLRGLKNDEIVLMRRAGNGKIEIESNLPPVEGLRVDQILNSPLFGLNSTFDPEIDRLFKDYYAELVKPDDERDEELVRTLKKQVKGHGVLGSTRRDQLTYDIIDAYLAREAKLKRAERHELLARTKERVLELWEQTDAWSDTP